jgi:hypothetical protein
MFYSIYNVIALTNSAGTAPLSAAIIDQAFQLIMLALVERPSVFGYVSVIKPFEEDKKLVDIIFAMRQMRNTSPSRAALIGFSQRYPSMFQRGYSLLAKSPARQHLMLRVPRKVPLRHTNRPLWHR